VFYGLDNVYKFQNGYIYILVDLEFRKNRINRLYLNKINDFIPNYTNENVKFKFVIKEDLVEDKKINEPEKDLELKYRTGNLNNTYSFDNFVIGKSNNFAFRMAMKVADQPGVMANPLYIFGDVGLGKTHLMQAIGNYILDMDINKKVLYNEKDIGVSFIC
jgi:chromosomal replication initiator protein